jgi:hypothetical protein
MNLSAENSYGEVRLFGEVCSETEGVHPNRLQTGTKRAFRKTGQLRFEADQTPISLSLAASKPRLRVSTKDVTSGMDSISTVKCDGRHRLRGLPRIRLASG